MNEYIDQKFTHQLPPKPEGHHFENCSFAGVDFKGLNLSYTRFIDCQFSSCDLSNVKMANARMLGASFECCKLLGLQWVLLDDLINPSFKECVLDFSNFTGLKLKKTNFIKCTFKEADFAMADFSECNFIESDFFNARFQNTTLLKADFSGAINYQIDPLLNKVRGARFSMPEAMGLLTGLGIVVVDT